MKPALQFASRAAAARAVAVLDRNSIACRLVDVTGEGSVSYPDFVDVAAGGVLLEIEDEHWQRGMELIWNDSP
jgi:hypothetical protein